MADEWFCLKMTRRLRWQIECLFGDSKFRGLNMEDTRLTQPAKLNTLLVTITASPLRCIMRALAARYVSRPGTIYDTSG
jgi:hypothetical protein